MYKTSYVILHVCAVCPVLFCMGLTKGSQWPLWLCVVTDDWPRGYHTKDSRIGARPVLWPPESSPVLCTLRLRVVVLYSMIALCVYHTAIVFCTGNAQDKIIILTLCTILVE